MRGRGAASRVPGSVSRGARRAGVRAFASAASSSTRICAGGVSTGAARRASPRTRTASARWPSAVSASPRPSAASSVNRWPLGSASVWTRSDSRYSGTAAAYWPRPLRMSASWRIEDGGVRVLRAEQIAAHRDGLTRHLLRLGRAAAVLVQEPGEIVEVGRHVGVPLPRDRAVDLEHLPEMGFGSSIVLLVLLDEGQVVEDGGERRVRLAIDLPGLGDAGVQHRPGLVGALQVAQDQAARRRRRDQVRPQVLAIAGPARRKAASAWANCAAASSSRAELVEHAAEVVADAPVLAARVVAARCCRLRASARSRVWRAGSNSPACIWISARLFQSSEW